MKLTAKELTRILNQPDYAIADGSLIGSVAAPNGLHGDLQAVGLHGPAVKQSPQRAPCAVWKNEREFQRAVVDAYAAWAAVNGATGILCHVANENAHRMPGIVAGMTDLLFICERGTLFIELKVGSGKLRESQREIHYKLQRMGYRVVTIWDSVEEVLSEIEKFLREDK